MTPARKRVARAAKSTIETRATNARTAAKGAAAASVAPAQRLVLPNVIVPIVNARWFKPVAATLKMTAGVVAPDVLRIPVKDANIVLRSVVHLVADIRADASPQVVWTQGEHELLVSLDKTQLVCASGLVTMALVVSCDQVQGTQRVDILFAVGSAAKPAGLVMSTFDRVQGPLVITDQWSEALIAFAWETLLTTAQQLTGALGRDTRKRVLVPYSIAAEANVLIIGAMARHDLHLGDA